MFSWTIHSTWDSSQFILTIPLHYIALLMFGFVTLLVLLFQFKSGHGFRNVLILGAAITFYGFLMLSSELRLDRASQTATIRRFQYYHWSTYTYPLKDIERIYVSTGSTTSQLRIQFVGGSTTSMDFLDQNGGKEEAAYAANHWLSDGQ